MKSVITCDLEGRIETFGKDAEEIFGYRADEVIGKARVSLFSPGLVVLAHVNTWLKTAREKGAYEGRTVFLKKGGAPFAADIKITPTFRGETQIGYCGVTLPIDVPVEQAMPSIPLMTRVFAWLVVTRAPFLTAAIVPMLAAAALAHDFGLRFWAAFVGGVSLHIAANTWNDYFDWKSGTDQANNGYFLPFSGGSRSLELGLVSEKGLFRIGLGAFLLASAIGAWLVTQVGTGVLLFGVIGAFSAFFYTAPPLRLVARRGLGELLVGANFGPLMVAGTYYAITGTFDPRTIWVGAPIGLLTAAILWINEIPDAPSDATTGKNTFVVTLGAKNARLGYIALVAAAFACIAFLPRPALATVLALPLAIYAIVVLWRHYGDRTLVRANAATIQLHLLFGLLLAGALWF